MKRLLPLELAATEALAKAMSLMQGFNNLEMTDDNLPVIILNVKQKPSIRIEIVANDYDEPRIGDELEVALKQLAEAKKFVHLLAASIISDSLDVTEGQVLTRRDSWIFRHSAWESNRKFAIAALNTMGFDGGKITQNMQAGIAKINREIDKEDSNRNLSVAAPDDAV